MWILDLISEHKWIKNSRRRASLFYYKGITIMKYILIKIEAKNK